MKGTVNTVTIQVNGKQLNADEIKHLLDIVNTQKIEVDSLKKKIKSVPSLKDTFRTINSLARKFSISPRL